MTEDLAALRVCNTDDLVVVTDNSRKAGLNRHLLPDGIASLDPDGVHVLNLVLWGHNADTAPRLHHRVIALLKVSGFTDPVTTTIDVLDSDWVRLHHIPDDVSAALGGGS